VAGLTARIDRRVQARRRIAGEGYRRAGEPGRGQYLMGAGTGRKFNVMWHGTAGRLRPGGDVLLGLLAGLSAALGFLVPPRSRMTAVH
jgi:hypothetical protein